LKNEDKSQKASAALCVWEDHFVLPRDHENGLRGPMRHPIGAVVPCCPPNPSAAWVHPSITPRHQRRKFVTKAMTPRLISRSIIFFLRMGEDRDRCFALGRMGSEAAGLWCLSPRNDAAGGIGTDCCIGTHWIYRHLELVLNSLIKQKPQSQNYSLLLPALLQRASWGKWHFSIFQLDQNIQS